MHSSYFALIVAGGKGKRMGSDLPKQYIEIAAKPIIVHTIEKFLQVPLPINLFIVLPEVEHKYGQNLLEKYFPKHHFHFVLGGRERFDSVKNGLNALSGNTGFVAIHDAVRPCISGDIILKSFEMARVKGSAITSVALKDSIREFDNENSSKAHPRHRFRAMQTPQTFDLSALQKAYEVSFSENFTDDASVYEIGGNTLHFIEGDYKNIKVTTQEDLLIAETLLSLEK